MNRPSTFHKAVLAVALAVGAFLVASPLAHAASAYGDPHQCEQLAQHSINSGTGKAEPFDAAQIPGSALFDFTNYHGSADSLVACQPHIPWQPNFNNADWDGYGNPFQCVELIDRYDDLRWHDTTSSGATYVWGDASADWATHPGRFQKEQDGGTTEPQAGDIVVWTGADHIAVITYVNFGARTATILEQNFTYNGNYYTASRTLNFNQVRGTDGYLHYVFTGAYTMYRQDGSSWHSSSGPQPDGWLHAN
jgi:hypothetical protein